MKAQMINNNQLSFSAIYAPKNVKFSPKQEKVCNTIKSAMREPLERFNGETAENFYKSQGYDFEIIPFSDDSVYLTGYRGMREIGVGTDRAHTYSNFANIGQYDSSSVFNIDDIADGIKEKNRSDRSLAAMFLMLPLAIVTMCILSLFDNKSANKAQDVQKPLIENVDSIANKPKLF